MKSDEKKISWGIIGCGDVAEVKSGPAFQKADNSELLAVMRRDGAKAKDFAERHGVPFWHNNASEIVENDNIDAVYIATPPSSHLEYALLALKAGKHVYLEKPMVLTLQESDILTRAVKSSTGKLVVAHYRRFLPMYVQVKKLIDKKEIGNIKFVDIRFLKKEQPLSEGNWRLTHLISGGGLFHDLAPHQLDLMYYFFGDYNQAYGFAQNQEGKHDVPDIVNGIIDFENGIQFRGLWNFNAPDHLVEDDCTIYGSLGSISFSFYGNEVKVSTQGGDRSEHFEQPENIQQPLIQEAVNYFLDKRSNPCSVDDGKLVMALIHAFT
ncbi:MAG: Gfo/Idh/MocA family oxidoreductase [Cyclobacteriaceae bacterium]